jgi:hypothetical protein
MSTRVLDLATKPLSILSPELLLDSQALGDLMLDALLVRPLNQLITATMSHGRL